MEENLCVYSDWFPVIHATSQFFLMKNVKKDKKRIKDEKAVWKKWRNTGLDKFNICVH